MAAESTTLNHQAETMGVCFESNGVVRLSKIFDRATVGSASSNPIVLDGKGIRPLQGQFILNEGCFSFRDFQDRATGSVASIGPWSFRIGKFDEMKKEFETQILESFKNILKQRNFSEALEELRKIWFCRDLPTDIYDLLHSQFQQISLLSPVESLLENCEVTDILIESFDKIWIERNGRLEKSSLKFINQETYEIYLENLLAALHKTIDEVRPYLDFVFPDGSRGHLVRPPLTSGPRYLSIRKKRKELLSLEQLHARAMFSADFMKILRAALSDCSNILISGSTGSGKTTLLKALLSETRVSERLVVIEDTSELYFDRENASFLYSRPEAPNHLPEINLRELVRQSLRMRPDRIIVGEVRGGEALDLMHAMNTGHRGCMGSLHANSTRDALFRLQGLIQMSSASLSENVTRDLIARNLHLLIHCGRDSVGGRKITEYSFVRGLDHERILLETHHL